MSKSIDLLPQDSNPIPVNAEIPQPTATLLDSGLHTTISPPLPYTLVEISSLPPTTPVSEYPSQKINTESPRLYGDSGNASLIISDLKPAAPTATTRPGHNTVNTTASHGLAHSTSTSFSSSTRSTVEAWLGKTSTSIFTFSQKSPGQDLKRKRSPSLDFEEVPLPLKRQLLRQHLEAMDRPTYGPQPPYTPTKSNPDSDRAPPSSNANPAQPTEDSKSTTSTSQTINDPAWVSDKLSQHMLYHNRQVFYDPNYREFKELVMGVASENRPSAAKATSVQKFREKHEYFKARNENTFLNQVLPLLIKDSRHVADLNNPGTKFTMEEFWDSGLDVSTDELFQRTMLPSTHYGQGFEKAIEKALNKGDNLTTPKPDRTYGFRNSWFEPPPGLVISNDTDQLIHIAPGMHAPFLIIEGKSHKGNLIEAENQARRGGATLVNAARELFRRVGQSDALGPDYRTYVYSATIDPKIMEVWIHWAEVQSDGKVFFHMNRIMGKLLYDDDALDVLRGVLHNIIEWGLGPTRYAELKQRYEALYTSEARKWKEKVDKNKADQEAKQTAKKADQETKQSAKKRKLDQSLGAGRILIDNESPEPNTSDSYGNLGESLHDDSDAPFGHDGDASLLALAGYTTFARTSTRTRNTTLVKDEPVACTGAAMSGSGAGAARSLNVAGTAESTGNAEAEALPHVLRDAILEAVGVDEGAVLSAAVGGG